MTWRSIPNCEMRFSSSLIPTKPSSSSRAERRVSEQQSGEKLCAQMVDHGDPAHGSDPTPDAQPRWMRVSVVVVGVVSLLLTLYLIRG